MTEAKGNNCRQHTFLACLELVPTVCGLHGVESVAVRFVCRCHFLYDWLTSTGLPQLSRPLIYILPLANSSRELMGLERRCRSRTAAVAWDI